MREHDSIAGIDAALPSIHRTWNMGAHVGFIGTYGADSPPKRALEGRAGDRLKWNSLPLRSDLEAAASYLRRLPAVFEKRRVGVVEVRKHDPIAGIDPTL